MKQPNLSARKAAIYSKLVECAMLGRTITYSELAIHANMPSTGNQMAMAVGDILHGIFVHNHEDETAILPALVVQKQTGIPGNGFFNGLADHHGVGHVVYSVLSQADKYELWQKELNKVFAEYQDFF